MLTCQAVMVVSHKQTCDLNLSHYSAMESLAALTQLLGAGILLKRTDLLESGQVVAHAVFIVALVSLPEDSRVHSCCRYC